MSISISQEKNQNNGHVERAYFLQDELAAENIEILREHMTSYISEPIPNTSPQKYGPRMPRYGVHSMLAMKTRFFAYDHPAMLERCSTAFTNGEQIWFAAPFLNAMVEEFKKDPKTASVFLVALHEISHILDAHFSRSEGLFFKYKKLHPEANEEAIFSIFNIGMDIAINQRLVAAFTTLKAGDIFNNTVWGLSKSEEKYKGWTEEAIIDDLFRIAKQRDENKNTQGQGQKADKADDKNSQDKANKENTEGDGNDNDNENAQDKANKEKGKGDKGDESDGESEDDEIGRLPSLNGKPAKGDLFSDMITPEEFIKIAMENGLEESLRKLGVLPDDVESKDILNQDGELSEEVIKHIAKSEKNRELVVDNTINEALNEMRKNGGKFPGKHLLEAAAVNIKEKSKPKLTWLMEAENLIHGGQGFVSNSYDNLHDVTMFDPTDMNMLDAPILEGVVPAEPDIIVAGIIDTSGSMTDEILSEKVTEAAGFVRKYRAKLILISADTSVRSDPIIITPENIDEVIKETGIELFGRGGTDIEGSMIQAADIDYISLVESHDGGMSSRTDNTPDAVIYFTDLLDGIPRKSNLPKSMHRTIFICPENSPQHILDEYNKEGFSVYPVMDGVEINLSKKPKP